MPGTKDPVCGMELDPGQIEAQSSYRGQKFNFCSEECKRLFDENPEEYVGGQSADVEDSQTPTPR